MSSVSILIASLCIFVRIHGMPLLLEDWEETPPPDVGLDPPSEDNEPSPKRIVYYIGYVPGANQSPSDGIEHSSGNMESSSNVEPFDNDGMKVSSNEHRSLPDAGNKQRTYTDVINGQSGYPVVGNGQRSYSEGNSDKKGMPVWVEEVEEMRPSGIDTPSDHNHPPSNPIGMILIGLQDAAQAPSNGKEHSSDNTKPTGYYVIEDISNGQRSYFDGNSDEKDHDLRINGIPLWIEEVKDTPSDQSSGKNQPPSNHLILVSLPVGIQSLADGVEQSSGDIESTGRDGIDVSNGQRSDYDGVADQIDEDSLLKQGVVGALIKLDQIGTNAARSAQSGLNAARTASKTIPVLLF